MNIQVGITGGHIEQIKTPTALQVMVKGENGYVITAQRDAYKMTVEGNTPVQVNLMHGSGVGKANLADLLDVDIAGAAEGDFLQKVGNKWMVGRPSWSMPVATDAQMGAVRIGEGIEADAGLIALKRATKNTLGGVIAGDGVTIENGVISVESTGAGANPTDWFSLETDAQGNQYIKAKHHLASVGGVTAYTQGLNLPTLWEQMPVASADVLGGVKVGANLTIADGVLSAHAGGNQTLLLIGNNLSISGGNSVDLGDIIPAVDLSNYFTKGESTLLYQPIGNYEPAIAAGTTLQYMRGDKSMAALNTLIVPESTNLYFTNARAIAAPLTGYVAGANTALAATDTLLAAFQKLQGQVNARMATASYPDLTAIEALTATTGFLRKTAANTWALNTTIVQPDIALTGWITDNLNSRLLIATFADLFEKKTDGQGNTYIEAKYHFASLGGVTAYAQGLALPTLWEQMPVASADVLGGVKVGAGLLINNGVLSTNGGSQTLAFASNILSISGGNSVNLSSLTPDLSSYYTKLQNDLIYQPVDSDLTAIAALAGLTGFLKKTAADTWVLDTTTYLSANQPITLTGVITGSGATAITTAIADAALSIAKTSGLQAALDARMLTASYPDIVAIEALAGTTGFLKKTAANTWTLDTTTYLSAITKAMVEAVLTGAITTHTHSYQPLDADLTAIAALATTGFAKRTAADTWAAAVLASADLPTITLTGGATGAAAAGSIAVTLTNTSVTGQALTGYVVGANTALAATDTLLAAFQKLQGQVNARMATASYPDLTAIEALTATTGVLTKTAANTWALNTTYYHTGNSNLGTVDWACNNLTSTLAVKGQSFELRNASGVMQYKFSLSGTELMIGNASGVNVGKMDQSGNLYVSGGLACATTL